MVQSTFYMTDAFSVVKPTVSNTQRNNTLRIKQHNFYGRQANSDICKMQQYTNYQTVINNDYGWLVWSAL